jgi:hypothetical protein
MKSGMSGAAPAGSDMEHWLAAEEEIRGGTES